MKRDMYECDGLDEKDIRRIEKALGLREGTIKTENVQVRSSEHRDFYIRVGFVDHEKSWL
jgi:hypothetical protein